MSRKYKRSAASSATAPPPKIIFEDQHLVVLDKPAGLLSQGESTDSPNVVDWLRHYFGRNYVGLIHRLDRNTSGLMVVAKRSKAADRLSTALRDGQLQRVYRGWLLGTLEHEAIWQHYLVKDGDKNLSRIVKNLQVKGAKEAILRVKPLENAVYKQFKLTLAEFTLETGRSHQIRVQAAAAGFPLLGDRKYSTKGPEFPRPALHSYAVSFPHPMSGELFEYTAPLPADLEFAKKSP